jgi:hypothetical protein
MKRSFFILARYHIKMAQQFIEQEEDTTQLKFPKGNLVTVIEYDLLA